MAILFIAFILLGAFMLALPRVFWMLTQQWKSSDATEASKLYIVSTRFGGAVLIIVGVLGLIYAR